MRDLLSEAVEANVRRVIAEEHCGDQPVGTCIVVEAPRVVDYLAHAVTMSVPMDVSGTLNAYYAFKAVLIAVARHRPIIRTLICPTFCTGVGDMHPKTAAAQMRLAWDTVFDGGPPPSWQEVYEYRERLLATLELR